MHRTTKISLIAAFAICEISCFFLAQYAVHTATILYALFGIGLSFIPMVMDINTDRFTYTTERHSYLLYLLSVGVACNWVVNTFRAHIYTTGLDLRMGDMLVFIKVMSERFIAHQHVYEPITSIYGSPVEAVYLPAFWLPYSLPIYLGLDMRWTSLAAFIATIVIIAFVSVKRYHVGYFFVLIASILFASLILAGAAYYLMNTQEAVVLLYVALLSWALIREYWIAAGIAAALCMMSRYYIGAPLVAGIVWLYVSDKNAAQKTIIATSLALITLLTISGTWSDIMHFCRIPILYIGLLSDSASFDSFRHILFYRSVGFASFLNGDNLYIITPINLAILVILPIVYFVYAYRHLSDRHKGLVLLCGIKLFLVLFLTTLSHPFGYVLYTSSIISMMLVKAVLLKSPQENT